MSRLSRAWTIVVAALLVCAARSPASAQIDPSHTWLTLRTPHFFVHFTRPIEPLARRLATDAERAYTQLSAELHPPRGMIDIVLTDDVDLSNGSATPYPTNRIVIYANPPVSESALRFTNDWAQMVVTHELTHIFHLDRTRGIWWLGQKVFGRAALLFPNLYDPSWLTEGLAVYEESKLAGAGRVEGSEHRMIARAAAVDHRFPSIGAISLAQGRFPFGESAYAFGSLFVDYVARSRGDTNVRKFVDKSAAQVLPYLINIPAKQAFGVSFSTAWREFRDSVARSIRTAPAQPLAGWRDLTRDGVFVFSPRWQSDASIIYTGSTGREAFGAYRVDTAGRRTRVGRRNTRSANVPFGDGAVLYTQLDFTGPYTQRSDLWVQRGGHERQLTSGQRLTSPDARADGEIVAAQIIPGATRLVRVARDGNTVTPLTSGSYDEQWTEPRWSHSGRYIAASRWTRGNISQIVIVDTTGRIVHTVSSGTSVEATPSWLPDDSGILYSSDRTGSAQVYVERFTAPDAFAGGQSFRVSNAGTGLFEPGASPASGQLAAVLLRGDGYHLGVGPCCGADAPLGGASMESVTPYLDTIARRPMPPVVVDSGRVARYSPWRTLLPRYWLPTVDPGIRNGYRIGAMTSGSDVIGRHAFDAKLAVPTNKLGGITGNINYQYTGLGLPIIQLDAAVDWESLEGIFARDASKELLGELFRKTVSGEALATVLRQRYRTVMSLTGGVGLERRTHTSKPGGLIPGIDTIGEFGQLNFPSLILGASYANYQRPALSISPEHGVQLNLTMRDRIRSGATAQGGQSLSTVGSAALYKSINLPGFAHHVLALRGAAGYADNNANSYFSVGGISGTTFQVIPGYVIGEGRKTFPVRGFPAGTLLGTRATAASAEYRIPLFIIGNSPGALPFFFDRSSLTLFGDYGWATCPNVTSGREVCNRAGQDRSIDIGSFGAELNLNLSLLSWDTPYRFRLGVAHPTQHGGYFRQKMVQVYVVSGISF